ncbi:MAG: dienelactone hydrolase [Proteobacteria bacterium]|nr:dienelactone hydrolase [Pseudomonadota bacterium]
MTVVRDREGGRRRPFLVLLHGRPASVDARIRLGQVTFPGNASYFAGLGFVVLIPTRVGYGVTGGPDLEYTGTCFDKNFSQGMAAIVEETRQVLDFASRLPDVDRGRGLVVGDSFGGVAAIAIASAGIPGVVAAINISGGDGGDSVRHVDHPCRPDQMSETLAAYGRSNRLPTLWMYSANDRLWGPIYPKIWFRDFTDSGGRGEFVTLPADKNNGHFIFNRNPGAWHPAFDQFIQRLGFDRRTWRLRKAGNAHDLSSRARGNREKSKHARTDVIVSPAAGSDQADSVEHGASTREAATNTSARRLFSK